MLNRISPLLRRLVRTFPAASAGNVTILFGLSALVLLGVAGAAIDYVRLIEQRTVYEAAADAAALAAISSAREADRNGLGGVQALAEKAALSAWKANIATSTLKSGKPPVIAIRKVGTAWTATVSFDDRSPTSFMGLLGVRYMKLAGTATASTTVEKSPNYWDFHVVVDTSSSMGIGATAADMSAMEADPRIGCAFACHSADYSKGGTDTASIAMKAGYKLRIDVVDDAVNGMVSDLQQASTGDNIRAELWGLNDTVGSLVDLTAKLADVKTYKLQLYQTPVSVGNTNYAASFGKVTTEIGKSGDGKSAAAPKKAVFIVTDGIHDTNVATSNVSYVWWSDHQLGTVDPAFCQTMKDNGVMVGVLYIDYIAPAIYADVMSHVTPTVLGNLKACATDGLFFNATTPDAITQAMKDMLKAAMGLGAVRLTN